MTDPRTDAATNGPDSLRVAVTGQELGSIDKSQAASVDLPEWDWPPVSFAQNDHNLVWWLPEYDDMLRRLVDEHQWAWRSQVLAELKSIVPETVLRVARGRSSVPRKLVVLRSQGLRLRPGQAARHSLPAAAGRRVLMLLPRIPGVAPAVGLHRPPWREPDRRVRQVPEGGAVPGRIACIDARGCHRGSAGAVGGVAAPTQNDASVRPCRSPRPLA